MVVRSNHLYVDYDYLYPYVFSLCAIYVMFIYFCHPAARYV
jgi:hypothetical protein